MLAGAVEVFWFGDKLLLLVLGVVEGMVLV